MSAASASAAPHAGGDRFVDLPAGPRICYRVEGPAEGVPLLLIAGLGLDLTSWPRPMVDGFVDRGFKVIRFDNRDAGRSSRMPAPPPGRLRQLLARPRPDAYDLADRAADAHGLLDHLDVDRAHLVGMSTVQASGDRTGELRRTTAPTLVVHGDVDRMVHPAGGRATATAIHGAGHVEITGVAHHLAPAVLDRLVELTTDLARPHGAAVTAAARTGGAA